MMEQRENTTAPPITDIATILNEIHELKAAMRRIEEIVQDTPRKSEIYTRTDIDAMVVERNKKLHTVEQELIATRANNEMLVNRVGVDIQQRLDEFGSKLNTFDTRFDNTIRGIVDTQSSQQRHIDAIIHAQRENSQQIQQIAESAKIALNAIQAWTPINETTQQQIRSIESRMSEIESEERDAADERQEINRRFELVTGNLGQLKAQMLTISNDMVSLSAQLKPMAAFITSEQIRREVIRRRWNYIKNMLTSKPAIAILYPIAAPLLSWIGIQIGTQLKLQEFVQTVITFLEHLTSSL